MLKHWDSHAEYQHFISEAVTLLNPSQLKKLYSMYDSWNKIFLILTHPGDGTVTLTCTTMAILSTCCPATMICIRRLNPDLPVKNLYLDSTHDNYPTYELCKTWRISPFIDLNSNWGRPVTIPKRLNIDTDGTPL